MSEKVANQGKEYLLILPCSKRKKALSIAPAIELYDGPFYRVLRKNMSLNLDVLILSAKYGLIDSNEIISPYDQIMTIERAKELANDVRIKLEEIFKSNQYDGIFINLGRTYMIALEESASILCKHKVCRAKGKIGERLHQLKNWLAEIDMRGAKP